jgi:hypothetical protein
MVRREGGWKLLDNGEVEAFPLAAHSTAALPPHTLLRLEFFPSAADFDARVVAEVQVHMTPEQARTLARSILAAADAAEAG